jgi:cyclase
MKKLIISLFFIILFQVIGTSSSIPELLQAIKVADNLYAIENPHGGNIAFLVTDEGILVVDAGTSPSNGRQIITAIESVSDKPIKYVVYTHLHGDHIYGIAAFPSDVKIIAHAQLVDNFKNITEPQLKNNIEIRIPENIAKLTHLMDSIPNKKSEEYLNVYQRYNSLGSYLGELKQVEIRYPDTTFTEKFDLTLGNEKIILEFLGSGHTNDNIVVRFPKQNVIHTGDLIFNGRIPYVLAAHGATVKGWTAVVEKLSAEKIQHVIPGHGSITNGDAFKAQASYFKQLTEKVTTLKNQGKSLDEIKKSIDIKEFGLKGNESQFPINIEVVFNEL